MSLPTVGQVKTKISKEIKEIIGPLKEALSRYQEALPKYTEAMKQKFPQRPPIDLDCNERRIRDSLSELRAKLKLARDAEAARRRDREEEVRVKSEIIAQREEIPNPFRPLLREMETTRDRVRTSKKHIQIYWKQMKEKRQELDEMEAWLKSGEPATKEMLRSVGLQRGSPSQSDSLPVDKPWSEGPLTASPPSTCSTRSCRRSCRSPSTSGSSRRSEATSGSGRRGTPTLKTRLRLARKTSAARAEYCPVGNKMSFRRGARGAATKTDGEGRAAGMSDDEARMTTKMFGEARAARSAPKTGGSNRASRVVFGEARRATSAEPKRTGVRMTLPARPKTSGDARSDGEAPRAAARLKPTTDDVERGRQPAVRTKPNLDGNARPREKTGTIVKIRKKPPWKPMA